MMTVAWYALWTFLLGLSAVILYLFRSRLRPLIRVLSWALALLVAVAAIVAATYYFGLWAFITSTVSGWSFSLPSLPAAPNIPAVSMPDIDSAKILWGLGVLAGITIFALFVKWAWRRQPGLAWVPRWFKQALLVAALVAAVVAVFVWAPQEHPYHPSNWPEGLRGWVSSWTLQTKQAVLVAILAALIGAWIWKGRLAALGVAAAALAAAIFLAPPGMLDDNQLGGIKLQSATVQNPLPGSCNGVKTPLLTLGSTPVPIPNCRFRTGLYEGTLRFQDNKGRPFKVSVGEQVQWPEGFEAILVRGEPSARAEFTFRPK